jgi:hypothetical protein
MTSHLFHPPSPSPQKNSIFLAMKPGFKARKFAPKTGCRAEAPSRPLTGSMRSPAEWPSPLTLRPSLFPSAGSLSGFLSAFFWTAVDFQGRQLFSWIMVKPQWWVIQGPSFQERTVTVRRRDLTCAEEFIEHLVGATHCSRIMNKTDTDRCSLSAWLPEDKWGQPERAAFKLGDRH